MKLFHALLTMILLQLFTGCISVSPGGGSSSEVVAVVHGSVMSENGTVVAGASVKLIPSEFDVLVDTNFSDVYECQSDSAGRYTLKNVKCGTYNLYAFNRRNGTKALSIDVSIDDILITLPANVLKPVATVKIDLPNTIDTSGGYIYLKGTDYIRNISQGTTLSNGRYTLLLDSVPAGMLPSIIYATKNDSAPMVIGTALVTVPGDTACVIVDQISKPVWVYPLIVGLTNKTAAYFTNTDSAGKLVVDFIEAINSRFNDSDPFIGVVCFRLDSLYIFEGSNIDEINKPLPTNFFQRLILNGFPENNSKSGWFSDQRTVYETSPVDHLFKKHTIDETTWQLGLACGCIPSSYTIVSAEKNPVNSEAFSGGNYFMFKPYECTAWDPYNCAVLNYYGGKPQARPCQSLTGYPISISILAVHRDGTPVSDAAVTLFGIKWQSYAVTDTVLSSITDEAGLCSLPGNPYGADPDGATKYCNFLIRVQSYSDTVYAWMPIDEIGIAYFEYSGGNFHKVIRFDNELKRS